MLADDLRPAVSAALKQANGDRAEAQRLLLHQAVNDLPLLLALTKNHLKAIAAAAIDHHLRDDGKITAGKSLPDTADLQLLNPAGSGLGNPNESKVVKVADLQPHDPARQASTWAKIAGAFKRKE